MRVNFVARSNNTRTYKIKVNVILTKVDAISNQKYLLFETFNSSYNNDFFLPPAHRSTVVLKQFRRIPLSCEFNRSCRVLTRGQYHFTLANAFSAKQFDAATHVNVLKAVSTLGYTVLETLFYQVIVEFEKCNSQ